MCISGSPAVADSHVGPASPSSVRSPVCLLHLLRQPGSADDTCSLEHPVLQTLATEVNVNIPGDNIKLESAV